MKTLGIIGGLGPESTIDYYRSIIALYREKTGNAGYPPIVMVSLDVDKGLRLLGANQLDEMAEYLGGAARQLAAAGADFALLSANSGHIVFEQLRRASPIPLISIVEATCKEVKRSGLTRVGLLGTRFTMNGRFYQDVFDREHIALVAPTSKEQVSIHEKYVNELLLGKFLPETREFLERVISDLKNNDAVQGIILAGTELPLILRDELIAGLPLFDTTQIHVKAAVAEMLGGSEAEHHT
jgi:aspartate racemase